MRRSFEFDLGRDREELESLVGGQSRPVVFWANGESHGGQRRESYTNEGERSDTH